MPSGNGRRRNTSGRQEANCLAAPAAPAPRSHPDVGESPNVHSAAEGEPSRAVAEEIDRGPRRSIDVVLVRDRRPETAEPLRPRRRQVGADQDPLVAVGLGLNSSYRVEAVFPTAKWGKVREVLCLPTFETGRPDRPPPAR